MKMNKLLFVPFLVGAFALTSCGGSQHYSVTLVSEGEHGTWKGNNYAQVGADYKATFIPETGCYYRPISCRTRWCANSNLQ